MPISIEDLTQETLDAIAKATTSGLLVNTGIQGVDLSGLVALVPVVTPARSAIPREIAGMGSQTATWRALLNVNNQQANPAVGMDFAGNLVVLQEQDVFSLYKPIAVAGRVTQDALAVAKNYADALSVAELQTMNQVLIGQDTYIINGQAWALPAPATPTVVAATTGGTIASGTAVPVKVAARSGQNYFYGGSGAATAAGTVTTATTTSTNSATATVAAVKGAVAYDWFVNGFYYTTTQVATVTITFIPTVAQALPNLPLLSNVAPTTPPTADTSFSANSYNGIIATDLGDYGATSIVTPGSGTSSGASWTDNGAGTLTLVGAGIQQLDQLNLNVWNSVQTSPTCYMVNAQQAQDISELVLGTSAATTFLPASDIQQRLSISAGGFVGTYVNRAAGGVQVPVEVHPRVAPGTIIARTDRVPFPGSNIGSVFSVRCQYDTARFDYASNYNPGVAGGGPRNDFEIRSLETLINRAPVAQAIVTNIAQSSPI